MASLLRKLSHVSSTDVKKVTSTLARSKTYESNLVKLEKRLPRQATVPAFGHSTDFDYKRDTKQLCKIMKHCATAHTLDLDYILHFLSSYTCEQRMILVRDLEFEYEYKLVDMVLERPESPIRSCTLAMLIEPIELYARDFHDLLTWKQVNKIDYDISEKLLEIVLALNNEDSKKFRENYENLFVNPVEKDIELVQGEGNIISQLLINVLEGKRYEENGHSATTAKLIAKRLYEAGEDGPAIDYDTFIKIFTRDTFAQLSAIFDIYEDKYGRPIEEAIEREFQGQTQINCFKEMVEFIRSPGLYYAKVIRRALDKTPLDYETVIRSIIGHQEKDLSEICLEYSKEYDEPLEETLKTRIDIMEIKRVLILIVTDGHDIEADELSQVRFDHSNNSSPTGSGAIPTSTAAVNTLGMRRNRSQEAFDKFVNVFKTMRPH
ncbi:unnamed protein product [Adineta ricciae]|uniref:Annexin n=1 Tax=Adineta ricciae TaxID=249248 RepID=A0A813N9X7_ADIRI|nr:unnamed protein product [Adineta ricciae]CAF1291981.1 unnamed protein product [Adineta ricciae]